MKKTITVLLADDHAIVREGLRKMLSDEEGIMVIGEADDGREAVKLTKKLQPDVVVMDIGMPLLNGMEATRQILNAAPKSKVLILSAHNDEVYVDRVIAVGASGYLIKQTSFQILAKAIRAVESGETFFDPSIAKTTESESKHDQAPGVAHKRGTLLSSREIEVLQLIAEGQMNKEIAVSLSISIKTVEKHRQKLMNKLGIHQTAGLTRYAINAGIIESSVRLNIP